MLCYHFSQTALPVISGHNPSGTSVRTVSQFAKSYNHGFEIEDELFFCFLSFSTIT